MVEIKIYPINKKFEGLLELYPPVPGNKILPEWYKKQTIFNKSKALDKKDYIEYGSSTIRPAKQCPAIQETLTDCIVVPSWSDIYIHKEESGDFNWEVEVGNLNMYPELKSFEYIKRHDESQTKGMKLNDIQGYGILKLISPYYYSTPKGYGLEFSDPFYHHRRNIKIIPGKAETDKWHEVNHPFEFYYDLNIHKKKSFVIKAGDPLFTIKPYKINDEKPTVQINKYNEKFEKVQIKNFTLLSSLSSSWIRYKEAKDK